MASDNNLAAMADRLNLTFCRDHIEESDSYRLLSAKKANLLAKN